jgi:hypothetical protein
MSILATVLTVALLGLTLSVVYFELKKDQKNKEKHLEFMKATSPKTANWKKEVTKDEVCDIGKIGVKITFADNTEMFTTIYGFHVLDCDRIAEDGNPVLRTAYEEAQDFIRSAATMSYFVDDSRNPQICKIGRPEIVEILTRSAESHNVTIPVTRMVNVVMNVEV